MIAITGANGNLGRTTISFLLRKIKPENIVAIVRDPVKIRDLEDTGIIIRQADYNNPDSLEKAFKGIDRLLQVSATSIGLKGITEENNVILAAMKMGVGYIIYTSSISPGKDSLFIPAKQSIETENALQRSGVPHTIFRNSLYMEVLPTLIGNALSDSCIFYPAGAGKMSFVSRNDIAEAIAGLLINNDGHLGNKYEITGNEAYTFSEVAELLGELRQIDVIFNDIPMEKYHNELLGYQLPGDVTELLLSMAKGISKNEFSLVDTRLESLLQRKLLSLKEYLREYVV